MDEASVGTPSALESRLAGTRAGAVRDEFLANSAYFPLANVLFEWLREGWAAFLRTPDPYTLLCTGFIQAWFLGSWRHAGRPRPFIGNLIGPAFYTVVEGSIEGPAFFTAPHHVAYWVFSVAIGLAQEAASRFREPARPRGGHAGGERHPRRHHRRDVRDLRGVRQPANADRRRRSSPIPATATSRCVAPRARPRDRRGPGHRRRLPRPASLDRGAAQALLRARDGAARSRARRRGRGEPRAHAPRPHRGLPRHPRIHRLERAPGARGGGAHARRRFYDAVDRGRRSLPWADPHQVHRRRGAARLRGARPGRSPPRSRCARRSPRASPRSGSRPVSASTPAPSSRACWAALR